jgi:hypothetical protein
MRFAWLRKISGDPVPLKLRFTHPLNLIFVAYNLVYWVPMILPFTGVIDYRTGFSALFVVILIRGVANFARNNVLAPEQGEAFPLRSP